MSVYIFQFIIEFKISNVSIKLVSCPFGLQCVNVNPSFEISLAIKIEFIKLGRPNQITYPTIRINYIGSLEKMSNFPQGLVNYIEMPTHHIMSHPQCNHMKTHFVLGIGQQFSCYRSSGKVLLAHKCREYKNTLSKEYEYWLRSTLKTNNAS